MTKPASDIVLFGRSSNCDSELLAEAKEKIKKLEGLFAAEIEEVAKLLKENQKLEQKLEATQIKLNAFKRGYEKLKGNTGVSLDLSKSIVIHSEIDPTEILKYK